MAKAISNPTVRCQECGKWFRWISPIHLAKKHFMTTDNYKEKYKLPYTQGLTSQTLKNLKSERQFDLQKKGRVTFINSESSRVLFKERETSRRSPAGRKKPRITPMIKERNKTHKMFMKNHWKEFAFNCLTNGQKKKGYGKINLLPQNERELVESKIRSGISDSIIAKELNISASAVQRHRIFWLGIKMVDGLRRISGSGRREIICKFCGKVFIDYVYPWQKYHRKRCNNKCKGLLMKKKNGQTEVI